MHGDLFSQLEHFFSLTASDYYVLVSLSFVTGTSVMKWVKGFLVLY